MELNGSDHSTVGSVDCNHENSRIISTYHSKAGITKRRQCKDCGHRWNTGAVGPGPKLSEGDVLEILGTPRTFTNTELGERYGVSRETIRQVRCGMIHKQVESTEPRPDGSRYCTTCAHFSRASGCRMQFPDFEELGPVFASECEVYCAL